MPAPQVTWTFHGTAAVPSYDKTLAWLNRFVGCVSAQPVTSKPLPVARRGGCCWLAEAMLEIAEPNAPDTPASKFLQRFGPGYLNLALQVSNMDDACEWLAAHGAAPAVRVPKRFCFTRPGDTCGLQLQWAELQSPDWDPRWGAPIPPHGEGLIPAPRIHHWGALVADVDAALARFRELWNPKLLFNRPEAGPGEPVAAVALPDGALALYRTTASGGEALWGVDVAKPRFHLMCLRVRDLAQAEQVFKAEGVRILRRFESMPGFVTDPRDTEGLCIAWTGADLPGDPRGPLSK